MHDTVGREVKMEDDAANGERGCVKLTSSRLSLCSKLSLLRLGLRAHLLRRLLMLLRAQEAVRWRERQQDAFLKWTV